jgi:hypothetical protein
MKSSEKAPSIFTKAGERWINNLLDEFGLATGNEFEAIHDKYDLDKSWRSRKHTHGRIPKTSRKYGKLVTINEPQYLLSARDLTGYSLDKTKLMGGNNSDPWIDSSYSHENFGRVRIHQEANARGCGHLFAPITGWDGEHFRWVTMKEANTFSSVCNKRVRELKKKLKQNSEHWVIHDEEYGEIDGRAIFLDTGMFWFDGGWKVSEAELFDGLGHPFGTKEEKKAHEKCADWSITDVRDRFPDQHD